jgi:hypothetical protein
MVGGARCPGFRRDAGGKEKPLPAPMRVQAIDGTRPEAWITMMV